MNKSQYGFHIPPEQTPAAIPFSEAMNRKGESEGEGDTKMDPNAFEPHFERLCFSLGLSKGRRLNVFWGLSLNDGTIFFLVILLDKTVSVG